MGVALAVLGTVAAVLADGAVGMRAGYALELLWVLGLGAVWQRVRARLLLTSGIGWVVAMAISTTATPTERGVPLGLLVGAGIALVSSLATRSGVGQVHKPAMEKVVLVGTGVLVVVGGGLLSWG